MTQRDDDDPRFGPRARRPAAPHAEPRADDCDDLDGLLHLWVEDELDAGRSRIVAAHLERCDTCRSEVRSLRAERLFLIENAVDAPRLRSDFASDLTATLEVDLEPTARDADSPESIVPADFSAGVMARLRGEPAPRSAPTSARAATRPAAASTPAPTTPAPPRAVPPRAVPPRAVVVGDRLPWLSGVAAAVLVALVALWGRPSSPSPAELTFESPQAVQPTSLTAGRSLAATGVGDASRRVWIYPAGAQDGAGSVACFVSPDDPGGSRAGEAARLTAIAPSSFDATCPAVDELAVAVLEEAALEEAALDELAAAENDQGSPAEGPDGSSAGDHEPVAVDGFGAVYGLVSRIAPRHLEAVARDETAMARRSSRSREEEPCADDLNEDGQADVLDIALGCQVFLSAATPSALGPPTTVVGDLRCIDPCY